MQPIAGGPAALQAQQEAEKKEEGQAVTRTAAQTVFEDTTRALAVLERSPTTATGFGAAALRSVPGTDARELQGHIDSIKGNIGIDQLLKIKASGAGLGQVPQSQLDMLASMLGNLDVTQNQRVLRENLVRVREIYEDIVRKSGGDPRQMMEERQQRQQTTPPGAKPLGDIFK
jgi:hypothetical protein